VRFTNNLFHNPIVSMISQQWPSVSPIST